VCLQPACSGSRHETVKCVTQKSAEEQDKRDTRCRSDCHANCRLVHHGLRPDCVIAELDPFQSKGLLGRLTLLLARAHIRLSRSRRLSAGVYSCCCLKQGDYMKRSHVGGIAGDDLRRNAPLHESVGEGRRIVEARRSAQCANFYFLMVSESTF
jgi:hypothetical protein